MKIQLPSSLVEKNVNLAIEVPPGQTKSIIFRQIRAEKFELVGGESLVQLRDFTD